jgi:CRP/FNR family transcriptional regulator, cyclic AMP receptor protein
VVDERARLTITDTVPGTFLALLDPSERLALLELGVPRDFPRSAIMMYEGEPGERVMSLESGRVKITRIEVGGHETLLSIRDPGDIVGELAVIDEEDRLATVTALESVRAVVIPASVLRAHRRTAPGVAVALLGVVARRFRTRPAVHRPGNAAAIPLRLLSDPAKSRRPAAL